MKNFFLLVSIFFLATTFSSNPPGWYQQQLPVNDFVNDIFFLDSLNGWAATVSYIVKTTNGGDNWEVTDSSNNSYYKIQFFDNNTGYRCGVLGGGGASVWKTTNSGYNWDLKHNFGFGLAIEDLQFLNEDTGWISSSDFDFGGIWKTTNGGTNWTKQLNASPGVEIQAINFLNKDTGWAISSYTTILLYRTINGGLNWNIQHTFSGSVQDVCFINGLVGFVSKPTMPKTTDGGFTWIDSESHNQGIDITFVSDSIGWAGADFNLICKTTNGGRNWFYQSSPVFSSINISFIDSLTGWAAGTGIVKTTNGGVTVITNNSMEAPNSFVLHQNYPNPFNPVTIINYELRITSHVKLKVFDIQGKEIKILADEMQSAGNYKTEFDGSGLNSGVFFYRIEIVNETSNEQFSETKAMVMLK